MKKSAPPAHRSITKGIDQDHQLGGMGEFFSFRLSLITQLLVYAQEDTDEQERNNSHPHPKPTTQNSMRPSFKCYRHANVYANVHALLGTTAGVPLLQRL
jgi:hypothetical protein